MTDTLKARIEAQLDQNKWRGGNSVILSPADWSTILAALNAKERARAALIRFASLQASPNHRSK